MHRGSNMKRAKCWETVIVVKTIWLCSGKDHAELKPSRFLLMGFRNNGLFSFCMSQNIRRIHSRASEENKREEECWSVVKMILISPLVVVSFYYLFLHVLIKKILQPAIGKVHSANHWYVNMLHFMFSLVTFSIWARDNTVIIPLMWLTHKNTS